MNDTDLMEEPPSRFFLKWADVVLRYRWALLLLTLASFGGSLYLIKSRIEVDTSIEAFANTDSPSQLVLEEYRDEFGRDSAFMVLIKGDVFSLDYLERLKALHEELAALDMEVATLGERKADRDRRRYGLEAAPKSAAPKSAAPKSAAPSSKAEDDDFGDFGGDDFAEFGGGGDEAEGDWAGVAGGSIIEETRSLINARDTQPTGDGIRVGELMDPFPTADQLPALKARVLADRTLVGQVVGAQGKHSVILVRSQFMSETDSIMVNQEVTRIAQRHAAPGFEPMVAGVNALSDGLQTLMLGDLKRMLIASVVLMLLMLAFMFRHPMGIIVPLMVVGIGAANTFGMMAVARMPVTMLSNILPAFLFCVGLGDSVHLISVYRDGMREGLDSHTAVRHAISHVGVPIFFTSLTTMVGLLSFGLASMSAIQQMGYAGAFGVFMAMTHSLVLLPIMLSFNKRSLLGARPAGEPDFLDRMLGWCNSASGLADDPGVGPAPPAMRRRRSRTLLIGLVVAGAAIFGVTTLRVWHNPLSWLPDGTPVKTAIEEMDEHVGGTATVSFLIDGQPPNKLKDRALLVGLDQLTEHIRAYTDPAEGTIVGNAIGLVDVVKETNRALRGGDQTHYRIPDTQRGVADALFLFENAGADELRLLATNDLGRAQMTIRIKWLEALSYRPLVDHIEAGVKRLIPEGARVQATGSVYTLLTTVAGILQDLIRSFGAAFIAIALIMILLLRSLKLGLIAMVPNLLPIAFILGFMGFMGIPIDMNNVLIASIVIGIAVDDTIHFLHHFRLYFERSGNVEVAIRTAMKHAGRAMVSTSVILAVGFSAYMGARMHNIMRFGLLIALSAAVALIVDLVLAPALLRLTYKRPQAAP